MSKKLKNMISTSDPRVCMIGHPAPAWLVNYADLMTELVCFFVVLYALSAALSKDVQKAKKDVEETMRQEQVAGEAKMTKDGLMITLQEQGENVFFTSGSADLSPRMEEIMDRIAPTLMKLAKDGHDIVVEGHTDNIPIRARFASNWELSTARATRVVQHMIHDLAFPPERLAAIGYGEYRPLKPNDTEEGRSANRRVVFFVKNKPPDFDKKGKSEKKTEEPAQTQATQEVSVEEPATTEEASTEPTVDNALPLPQEAPAEETIR